MLRFLRIVLKDHIGGVKVRNGGKLSKISFGIVSFCILTVGQFLILSTKWPGASTTRVWLIALFYVLFLFLALSILWLLLKRKFQQAVVLIVFLLVSYGIYAVGILPAGVVLYENTNRLH